jgi:hypothetical protein
MFLGHSTSGMNAALAGNTFVEANTMPANELWGDLYLDLNDDWVLYRSIIE